MLKTIAILNALIALGLVLAFSLLAPKKEVATVILALGVFLIVVELALVHSKENLGKLLERIEKRYAWISQLSSVCVALIFGISIAKKWGEVSILIMISGTLIILSELFFLSVLSNKKNPNQTSLTTPGAPPPSS